MLNCQIFTHPKKVVVIGKSTLDDKLFLTQLSKLLTHVPPFISQNKIEHSFLCCSLVVC